MVMFAADAFLKYCSKALENNFGHVSYEIIDNVLKKQKLDEQSKEIDAKKFVDFIESKISILSGKQKAIEVCNDIRSKLPEFFGTMKEEEKVESKEESKERLANNDVVKITDVGKIIEIGGKKDIIPSNKGSDSDNVKDIVHEQEIVNMDRIDTESSLDLDLVDNKILFFLESDNIDNVIKKLNIDELILADKIIELDEKGFIILEEKNWILTDKGKDILKVSRNLLTKLKLDYLHGNINKEEFIRRSKELEFLKKDPNLITTQSEINRIEKQKEENIIEKQKEEEKEQKEDNIIEEQKEENVTKIREIIGEEEKIICPKCNTENRVGNRFCTKCGEALP